MTEEQMIIWNRHVDDYRQHRAEYLHLLHLDEDEIAKTPGRAATLKPHMIGLRQLLAECDTVLAVDAMVSSPFAPRPSQLATHPGGQ